MNKFDKLYNIIMEELLDSDHEILYKNETLALIPGAFKPPHKGHWEMVMHYVDLADKIIVLISPKSRLTADGKEITAEMSKAIFEIYISAYNLKDKVGVKISDVASPISAAFNFIDHCENCTIYLVTSKKGGDESRWNYVKHNEMKEEYTNNVIPDAVEVQTLLSATELRNNINNLKKEWFPDKLSNKDIQNIEAILNE